MLTYKDNWYGAELTIADRFYPSTRRCGACGDLGKKLGLGERRFCYIRCGHEADRDVNAAANLARYPEVVKAKDGLYVAAKHAETQSVWSVDVWPPAVRETPLDEAKRASAQRPRRAVSTKTVNTL
jgi:transposase